MHPVTLQFHTGLIASLFCLPVLVIAQGTGSDLFDPVWPTDIAMLWLLGVGFFATVSHMMMTYALSLAPSATLAPLQYFELPVATLFGYLVFSDFPNKLSLTGIAIIISAGLYMIHRERVVAKQLVTERASASDLKRPTRDQTVPRREKLYPRPRIKNFISPRRKRREFRLP